MKRLKSPRTSDIEGFSILEAMVTIGLISIAGMALMGVNVTGMKANKSAGLRSDLQDIKRTITNLIDCDKTLGAVKPTTCSGPVTLKGKNGKSLVLDGKIGDWTIESTCESLGRLPAPGLSIYATKPGKIDPLRNIPLNKDHPISSLFNPDVRLCGDNFTTSNPAEELNPLYGRKTLPITGTANINNYLKKGIALVFNATFNPASGKWSNADAQQHWNSCELTGTNAEQGDKINAMVAGLPQCTSKICAGFFNNKAGPINYNPIGWCGNAVPGSYCYTNWGSSPMVQLGCRVKSS